MKSRRLFVTPAALTFLLALLGSLMWGTAANAAVTVTNSGVVVPITGVVAGAPETVSFSGNATISLRLVPADPGSVAPPMMAFTVDLTQVTGTGLTTGKTYIISGPEIINRPLGLVTSLQVTFPFLVDGDFLGARTGLASFAITYNPTTNSLSLTTGIASPNVTTTAAGTSLAP